MKNLKWLNANKFTKNITRLELVILNYQKKPTKFPIKIKLSRERLYSSKSVKFLGIKIYEYLNWKDHIHDTLTKLNRANTLNMLIFIL